jgi:aryl-alcohol dehydrogenase-like predicted oxidoreductase
MPTLRFANHISDKANPMEHTYLGRLGLKVSKLCLGTMNFGPQTTEPDSFAIMDRALEVDINFFDSANVYGGEKGRTESIVGNWLHQGGRREQIVLATKVYGSMGAGVNDGKLSAYHIVAACDASLKRLQTDHIDLYQMHHVDRATPWEEIWQAMEQLVRQGKVLYVGSSNFAGWHIAQANEAASKRNFMGLVSEQCRYSLCARSVEMEVIPAAKGYGLGVIPWSPLAGGLLGGGVTSASSGRREKLKARATECGTQLQAYETLCQDLGEQPSNVALAWLLHNPVVTAPIIGPRTIEQLNSCLPSVELKLSQETLDKLDEIWPGPGGEAPEAFAW